MFPAYVRALRSGSSNSAVVAALVMSIIPAHIMRSVGGGYDNESLAVTAMCLTFFVWCRALRNKASWWIGALAGLAYVYMVAAWGGYTFVLNMVGLHAAILVIVGGEPSRPSSSHRSFFYLYDCLLIERTRHAMGFVHSLVRFIRPI